MSAPESNRRAGSVAAWAIAGALCLVTSCTAPSSLAQVKPPPVLVRWLVLRPPPVELVSFVCTAPLESNFGTCEYPEYRAYGETMTVRWRWSGSAGGEAFIMAAPGDSIRISVPASAETLTVVTERYGKSCGSVSAAVANTGGQR